MKLSSKSYLASALCVAALVATGAQASSVAINKDLTSVHNIPGLTGFMTLGLNMAGMQVTAVFSGGLTQTLAWATTGVDSGGVTSANGWSLNLSGDTFSAPWNFAITNDGLGQLVQLILAGAPGLTVWDTTEPSPGTDGSASGADFAFISGCATCDVTVDYTDVIAITPASPVSDLFHTMTVNFGQTGIRFGEFTFRQDADNDARLLLVSEPGGLALVGLALAGMGMVARRRASKA